MKLELPEKKKLVHRMTIPIRWGDMDAMGHVNNTVYFRYLETIRIDWLQGIGCAPDPLGEGPVIVNAFCTFHKQLEYPGDVVATGTPTGVGMGRGVYLKAGDRMVASIDGIGSLANEVRAESA